MLQDRGQKSQVLRYLVAKRWYPLLEVDVIPPISTSAGSNKPITDVDVLGLIPDQFEGYRRLLIDCKSKKSESPIARTLWLSGLMNSVGAERGICILKKPQVELDHRYYAAEYGVLLLTEDGFVSYSRSTGVKDNALVGRVGKIRYWEEFFDIGQKNSKLAGAVSFLRQGDTQSGGPADLARKSIVELTKIGPELDPAKPPHLALFQQFVAQFCIALASLTHSIFAGYLLPTDRSELESALLLLMYGGKDSYNYRNSLSKLYQQLQKPEKDPPDLSLPQWDLFVQLIRQGLDAPDALARTPLLITELAWSHLDSVLVAKGESAEDDTAFAELLTSENPNSVKFGILAAEYLRKAAKIPKEFDAALTQQLMVAQRKKSDAVVE